MIKVDISKCTGCKRCESVCAFFHTGRINNHLARIKIINIYEIGIDGPVVCIQCSERYCMNCPSNALTIGPFGQVIVSPTLCTLCCICEAACPIGAIEIFNDLLYVCDLCGGKPKCIEACTEGAITYDDKDGDNPSLSIIKDKTSDMNTSQKQYFYLKNLGLEVREKWRKQLA